MIGSGLISKVPLKDGTFNGTSDMFSDLTSKKRKRNMMSDSGASDESNTSTTDLMIREGRNPIKRLRRQLEEL